MELLGLPLPTAGEAQAILQALKVAKMNGWPNIVIESDCSEIISVLSDGFLSCAPHDTILESCLSFRVSFLNISFC